MKKLTQLFLMACLFSVLFPFAVTVYADNSFDGEVCNKGNTDILPALM